MNGRYDAIVLTGGRARRMGGADKAALVVGGRTLASRVSEALGPACRVIVVGPVPVEFPATTIATEEAPPGGGPVAAVAAGVAHVTAGQVAVVAIDMPFVSADALDTLAAAQQACSPAGVALAVDDDGRDQPLSAVWGTDRLRALLHDLGDPAGMPMHRLIGAAGLVARVPGLPATWFDCDTPADLAEAEWRAS